MTNKNVVDGEKRNSNQVIRDLGLIPASDIVAGASPLSDEQIKEGTDGFFRRNGEAIKGALEILKERGQI